MIFDGERGVSDMAEQQEEDDYPYGFAKGQGKIPPRISGNTHWSNELQADIFEIVIGPFKSKEAVEEYGKKVKWPEP